MKAAIRQALYQTRTSPQPAPQPLSLLRDGLPAEGRTRSSLNAFQHGLTGQHMILQAHEREAYVRLTEALTRELSPATESERQLVLKIIDCHARLNRIAALENNILNIGVATGTHSESTNDDQTECIIAQARCWSREAVTFDRLGRYEARISRQLLNYTRELERIQALRKSAGSQPSEVRQTAENKPVDPKTVSFRQTPLWQTAQSFHNSRTAPDKLNLHQCPPVQTASRP